MLARIDRISSKNGKKCVVLSDRKIEIDFIFFDSGTEPHVKLARKLSLDTGKTRSIVVNSYLQVSNPDIYSVGDCMEYWHMIVDSKRSYQLASNAI